MGSKRTKKKSNKKQEDIFYQDCDENFSFIAGYTSWGVPYGIMRDEVDADVDIEDEELPFD